MAGASSSVRNTILLSNKYDRIVVLVDMDCFYCQVEEKLQPELKGQPLAVVQYNAWRGGGIIAVNYAARAKGVTRHMRGDEAKEQCPDIVLVQVPNVREKADLSKYRDAGREVANVLQRYTQLLERASVDEAYLDITGPVNKRFESLNEGTFVLQPHELVNTYAVGHANIGEYVNKITTRFASPYMNDENFLRIHEYNDLPAVRQSDIRLLIGASIAGEIRATVKSVTGYECSAGIAHNKILAKFACGLNKPNKQTILPLAQIPKLFETVAVGKITGLGGKFGEDVCERLGIKYLGQLLKFTEAELQRKFNEKNGTWLFYISRGIDLEAVTPRFYSKSIGCCKKFPGRNNITGLQTLQHWLNELANEINERLEKDINENNRKAKQMVVSYIQEFDQEEISSSRSVPLTHYDQEILAKTALDVIKTNTTTFIRPGSEKVLNNPIKFLGISAGKFETISNAQTKLQDMFANQVAKKRRISEDTAQRTEAPQIGITAQSIAPPDEQSKEQKQAEKMKSYLANYFQSNKNENQGTNEQINPKWPKNRKIESSIPNGLKQNQEMLNKSANEKEKNPSVAKQAPKNSYFANYFAKEKIAEESKNREYNKETETQLKPDKKVDVTTKTQVKSSFDNYFGQQNRTKEMQNKEYNNGKETKLTNIDKKYDMANETKAPKAKNTLDANLNADMEIQILAAELEEIERSNEKVEELCNEILTLNEELKPICETKKNIDSDHNAIAKVKLNDYKNSYAEYAIPEMYSELVNFVKCSECGAKIPDDARSLQSHQDHHFAKELSQQQRAEYRSKVQSKMTATKASPNNSAGKKQKAASKTGENGGVVNSANSNGITKYLKASNSVSSQHFDAEYNDGPSTSAAATEPMELCKECDKYVRITQFSEHMDFHVAKQLERKINQLEVRTVVLAKKPNSSSTATKKEQSTSLPNTTQIKTNKSITRFFASPN